MPDKKQDTTDLAKLLEAYNAGKGGPEGRTLMSIIARQSDPRAQHWAAWEYQRRKDANNGGILPEELPAHIPQAYISNEPQVPMSTANRVQGMPMAPGEYEAMMREYQRRQILSLGRSSPLGREQALQNASNNIGLMWNKQRIDNMPMPAEYAPMGAIPGSSQNALLSYFLNQISGRGGID